MQRITTIITKIISFSEQHHILRPSSTIIIGLSGGPDSVFLLHFLAGMQREKDLKLIAAHLDHEWRPESAQDAQFCVQLAQKYQIPIEVLKFSELALAIPFNGSKEDVGRKARRSFFTILAKKYSADAIALAHHADDQQETFFIRLMRGASLTGLTGMRPREGLYIRPLLETKKEDILAYLKQEFIPFFVDMSNMSEDFLRNRIRTTVIPALKNCDPRFDTNFHKTQKQLQQAEEFLQQLAKNSYAQLCTITNSISIEKLLALHEVLQIRILVVWLVKANVPFTPSQALFDEIIRFLQQPSKGAHTLGPTWQIKKEKGVASIVTLPS